MLPTRSEEKSKRTAKWPAIALIAATLILANHGSNSLLRPPPAPFLVESTDDTTGSLLVHLTYLEDGTPGAGIGLWADLGDDDIQRSERMTLTDERGFARLEKLPPGPIAVELDRCAGGSAVIAAGRETRLSLSIPDGADVTVRVVHDGAPVADAEIALFTSQHLVAPLRVARTDSDGRATLRDVAVQRRVRAIHPAHTPSSAARVLALPGTSASLDVEFPSEQSRIVGRVLDCGGQPAAQASVRLLDYLDAEVSTDEAGRYVLEGVPRGGCRVEARLAQHLPWIESLIIGPGRTQRLDFRLAGASIVTGTILDAEGRPASGVDVALFQPQSRDSDSPNRWQRTDAEGRFRFEGLHKGASELRAVDRRMDRGSACEPLNVFERLEQILEVSLSRHCEIRGRVIDERGEPRRGVHVLSARPYSEARFSADDSLKFPTPNHPSDPRDNHEITDQEGRFRFVVFDDQPRDLAFVAPAVGQPPEPAPLPSLLASWIAPGDDSEFVLPNDSLPTASVQASIVYANGQPCRDAVLRLSRSAARATRSVEQPLQGTANTYRIEGLTQGEVQLQIVLDGNLVSDLGTHMLHADSALDLGTIQLPPMGVLRVEMESPATNPARRWSAFVRSRPAGSSYFLAPTSERSVVRILVGNYTLEGMSDDSKRWTLDLTIAEDREAVIAVDSTGVAK